jgi:hypothetical protein
MIALGFVIKTAFIDRYTEETVRYIFPIAEEVDKAMLSELQSLVVSRRKYVYALSKEEPQPQEKKHTLVTV